MEKKNRLATMVVNLMKATMTFCLLCLMMTISVKAQSNVPATNTKNSNDKTKRTFNASLAQVNPTTLGLELALPLGEATGRAGNSLPIALNYSSKVWRMNTGNTAIVYQGGFSHQIVLSVVPTFDEHSAAGWTSSLQTPYLENADLSVRHDANGNSSSCPRGSCVPDLNEPMDSFPCGAGCVCEIIFNTVFRVCTNSTESENYSLSTIFRIIVHLPDGSTRTLVKNMTPVNVSPSEYSQQQNGTYFAIDGSNLRLAYNSNSSNPSVLYLPDGSRYIFSFDANGYQTVQYIDRHGNRLNTINNTTLQRSEWQDTMGRTIASPPLKHNYTNQNENGVGDFIYETPGMGNSKLEYTFRWQRLGAADVLDTGETIQTVSQLFEYTNDNSQFNPVVLKEIVMPNDKNYVFKYNKFGEITYIKYPTGAVDKFRYEAIPPYSFSVGTPEKFYSQGNRGVVERWQSPDGNTANEQHWQYSIPHDNNLRATAPYRVITTAPDDSYSERYLYVGKEISNINVPTLPSQLAGKTYEERFYAANGTLLRRVLSEYNDQNNSGGGGGGGCISICPESEGSGIVSENSSTIFGSPSPYLSSYPRVTRTTSVIFESGSSQTLTQSATYLYDGYSNVKKKTEYDFSVLNTSIAQTASIENIPFGNPLRIAETNYKTETAYIARQMVSLPTMTQVKTGDENETVVAKSEIFYDEAAYSPLTANTTLPSFASNTWEDPQTTVLGNATTTRSYYDITNSLYIEAHAQTDKFGNPRKVWDGRGNVSEIQYDQQYAYAYPTKTITPVPAPTVNPITNEYHGSQTAFETTTTFDFNTGLPLTVTDANGNTTTMEYVDSLLRPTRVYSASTGAEAITEYGDTVGNLFVRTKTKIDATNYAEGTQYFDGLGRATKTQSKDNGGDVFAGTQYDVMNRLWKVSNPYRTGETVIWTTSTYDDLGRIKSVKTPDNAEVVTTFSLSTSGNYIGTQTTVTDQAGKKRRSVTDVLGRLVRVDEPKADTGELDVSGSPYQSTNYGYDVLGNLLTVNQGVQTRTFVYDSLSRLISATNPKLGTTPTNGTITYNYDSNGNLLTKTDPRQITTSYSYDALNRVVTRNYSDNTTPNVSYFYDGTGLSSTPSNSKGQLTKVSNGLSETRYTAFDALGKVLSSQQITNGLETCPGTTQPCTMSYTYNLAGAMVSETYPSGRVVTNSLNNDGSLANVSSKANSTATPRTYANAFVYTPSGAVSSMRLGNGRFESTQFNSRLQPIQIALGTSANNTSLLKLNYDYGELNANGTVDVTKNNGNVAKQTITVPGMNYPLVQTYTYDALNRIQSATETSNSTQSWKQTYSYDRYGNRSFDAANTTTFPTGCPTAVCNPSFDNANNRMTANQGYEYDSAGNVTKDATDKRFIYDAENKQTSFGTNGSSTNGGSYFYDGDGKRVKKIVGAETTIFVYNASGQLVAEYSTTAVQNPQISYLTSDTLGSPRINTNASGQVTARHDYMPFGEEIIGLGNRQSTNGYQSDDIRQKFTSYERDNETELDFAQARYFNYGHGRFTSPDDFLNDTYVSAPQSWNLYVYVRNNPLRYVDWTGEEIQAGDSIDMKRRKEIEDDIKKKSGYTNVKFNDETGMLEIDFTEAPTTGSQKYREDLQAAVKDPDLFVLTDASNSEVVFSDISQDLVATAERRSSGKGDRVFTVRVDFADFDNRTGDKDVLKASSIGYFLIHEFIHYSGVPIRDEKRFADEEAGLGTRDGAGPIEKRVNEARQQNGDLQRLQYKPTTTEKKGVIYGHLEFGDGKTKKILTWKERTLPQQKK